MLNVSGVSKSYGERDLLKDASLLVNRGERIGLVGPNGAGKSTLIKMILGWEEPDEGDVTVDRRATIGFLPQETAQVSDETVLEIAISTTPEMVALRRAVIASEAEDAVHLHSDDHTDPHTRYAEVDGYQIEARAKTILNGLAFRDSDFDRPARELSGGWVMRAHLARLLVQEPDLLLLDEPTNHLDLSSLLWFQGHLQQYPGAILMVSHDRAFLNALVDSVVELRFGQLIRYRGNYDQYLEQRAANEAILRAAHKNQQKEIGRLMEFVDRFKAKASKAAQAQSKLKQIERMERIEIPDDDTQSIGFSFPQPQRSGQKVLALKQIHFGYNATPIYSGLDFEVERDQRVVLVGPNGAGKSTLLKLMAGVLQPQGGERVLGHNVRAGYYSQNRVEMLRMDRNVLQEASDTPQRVTEQFIRTLLGSFLFCGDDVLKPVKVLSGGEKSRLALVKLLLDPPNFLLMDEPTTHLDMSSIDALIGALQQFQGTIVFISHDVHFIRALANQVVHVEHGQARRYLGNYDYYVDKTASSGPGAAAKIAKNGPSGKPAAPKAAAVNSGLTSKEQRRIEAEARQARSRVRKDQQKIVDDLEKQIHALEKRQTELTKELEAPESYTNGKAVGINRELRHLTDELAELHKKWEAAATKLETIV